MGKLRQLIRDFVARLVLRNLTIENVKAALAALVGYLETQAKTTETVVDDWIVDGLRAIVEDEAKMKRIFDFIQTYVTPPIDGVCQSLPTDVQWQTLADEVAVSGAGITETNSDGICKAISVTQWLTILQLVLPPIMDAFERFFKDKEKE